jgi:predicted enzyme related to lactoylglutathione lyase
MSHEPVLRSIDAVTLPVPDLDRGLTFYRDDLGQELLWRDDELGQAGLRLPDSDTELVLSTRLEYAPNWLVASVDDAVESIVGAGGSVLAEPTEIPVGHVAVVADPFGNALVLLDLSTGRYAVDESGHVTGVTSHHGGGASNGSGNGMSEAGDR